MLKFVGVSSKHLRVFLESLWQSSEILGKCSGTFVWPSEQFWKIFGNLRKVVGNLRKIISQSRGKSNISRVSAADEWDIRDLQIGLRVRDWVRERLFKASFQVSHYHGTYPFHPMSYSLYLKPTWRTRALETSLVWNLKIVLVLNLVLVVQSEAPYCSCHSNITFISSRQRVISSISFQSDYNKCSP